jgi:ornithine cyclodeaminase
MRKDAKVLGMIGAGHQAGFQLRAALETHQFEKVIGWNYHPEMLPNLARVAEEAGLPFEAVELDGMQQADAIISITSSFDETLLTNHVSPGTHIACMGTDTKGKQELSPDLLAKATVFTDEVAQSISIGEAQHAIAAGLIKKADIGQLGAVINRTHPGRTTDAEITIFDGTGVGLQDLAVASAIVDVAVSQGQATMVPV